MQCPICKRPVAPPDPAVGGPYPFCSERCKLIDLGRWLDAKYQIPVEEEAGEPDTSTAIEESEPDIE